MAAFGFDADFSHVRKVGVLGAGVAGLQVAEQLLRVNIKCTLFEKASDVGGVWRRNYADFGLQVPKELYEFPSYPFMSPHGSFPKGPEVQDYIRSFAKDKGIYEMIRFNTEVLRVVPHTLSSVGGRYISLQLAKSKSSTKTLTLLLSLLACMVPPLCRSFQAWIPSKAL